MDKSPIAYAFGLAVCNETHYTENPNSMTAHAIRELKSALIRLSNGYADD